MIATLGSLVGVVVGGVIASLIWRSAYRRLSRIYLADLAERDRSRALRFATAGGWVYHGDPSSLYPSSPKGSNAKAHEPDGDQLRKS